MPLYRTVSDRGLWKKYKKHEDPQPQHFHKPSYIQKSGPVVTYSHLDLGDGYRVNSRQSIPDIGRNIADANSRFDEAYSREYAEKRNRYTKSCPTTPGTTTPTRTLSRARIFPGGEEPDCCGRGLGGQGRLGRHVESPQSPPGLVNGTGQYFPEDDRYSFDSRSLTAFSNYSERESVPAENGYSRYPYGKESRPSALPAYQKDNPFIVCGQVYNSEVENVVHLFLQNSAIFPSLSLPVSERRHSSALTSFRTVCPGRIENLTSPISFAPSSDRINGLGQGLEPPKATSSPQLNNGPRFSSREAIKQLRKEFLAQGPPPPKLNPPKPNKYLTSSRRNSTSTASEPLTDPAANCTNHHLPGHTATSSLTSEPVSSLSASEHSSSSASTSSAGVFTGDYSEAVRMALSSDAPHFMSDTVQQEELPRVHHAEVVSVRREDIIVTTSEDSPATTTNSESSSDDDDEERSVSSRNIMINIKPMSMEAGGTAASSSTGTDSGGSDSNIEQVAPRLEAPPQKQNVWGATRQKLSTASLPPPVPPLFTGNDDQVDLREQQQQYFPEAATFSYEQMQLYREEMKDLPCSTPREEMASEGAGQDSPPMPELMPARGHFVQGPEGEFEPNPDRNFQDPAFTNFQESGQVVGDKDLKPKKKGSIFSFFKKSGRKRNPYGDDFIHVEPKQEGDQLSDSEQEERIPDLHGDQSPRFHILPLTTELKQPMLPQPGGTAANKCLFPDASSPPTAIIPAPGSSSRLAAALYDNGSGSYSVEKNGSHLVGETDLDAAYEERQQGRPLERKLSMSKPTNLDELLSEELDGSNPADQAKELPVADMPGKHEEDSQNFFPDHERTQEIDIDAILFGDCLEDTPEETEEELDKENANFSFNSNEIDTVTRYNTRLNSGPIIAAPVVAETSYSALDKITTFNGETTFSASPPSPGYMAASLTEAFQSGPRLGEGRSESAAMPPVNSYHPHHQPQQHHSLQQPARQEPFRPHQPQIPILVHEQLAELQPQELELERQLQQLELRDRALLEEQKMLEAEQQRLALENGALQAQLEAKEREREASEAEEKKKRKKTEVVFSEKKQVFTQRFNTKVEEPKKPKPKSIFNFDSLKKKNRKNKQLVTEGYDSAYEDLTDNEETGKGYRKKDKKQFQFPEASTGADDIVSQQTQNHTQAGNAEAEPNGAATNGNSVPPQETKKRGFTKFLAQEKRTPPQVPELPPADDPRESDTDTVIVHPDEPVGSIPPPAEFRQNSLAESIVKELKKSSAQLASSPPISPAAENRGDNSFSRGKNRFSMRKSRKDSVKDQKENGVAPPSKGQEVGTLTSPVAVKEELLGSMKNRFSMRKPKKAIKEDQVKNNGALSEVESGEDSGSLSRMKNRFSLRKPRAKSQGREEPRHSVSKDYESAPETTTGDSPPAIGQQSVENDQNEQAVSNQIEPDRPERSRSTTPNASSDDRALNRQDSRNKKSSSSLAGIFGMRASKRTKSTERPKSTYSSQPPKGVQQPHRPRSAADLSKAATAMPQTQPPKRPKGNLANYFGVPEEIGSAAEEPMIDSGHIKKSQSADLVLEKVEDNRVGLISQSKSIIGMDSELKTPTGITYTEVDFTATQNSRKVAEEIKSRFQAREEEVKVAPVHLNPEDNNVHPPMERPQKMNIERPKVSPPARPQKTSGEKPPSGAVKAPKLLNVFTKNPQTTGKGAKEASDRSQKKMADSQEAAKQEQQQREEEAAFRQQQEQARRKQQEQEEILKQQRMHQEQEQRLRLQQQQRQQHHQTQQQRVQEQPEPRLPQHQNLEHLSNSRPPSSLDGSVIGGRGRQTGRQSGRFRRGGAAHTSSNHNLSMSHNMSVNQSMNSSFDQDSIADQYRNHDSSLLTSPDSLDTSVVSRTESYRRARPDDARRPPHRAEEVAGKKKMFGFF